MNYHRIELSGIDMLWKLHKAYKAEIGENAPEDQDRKRLEEAVAKNRICFFGVSDGTELVGCCSVMVGFSTFNYAPSGIFEDFYILPQYRHRGLAKNLVLFARAESGVSSMIVGCADCDVPMYRSLGFKTNLGNMLAFE